MELFGWPSLKMKRWPAMRKCRSLAYRSSALDDEKGNWSKKAIALAKEAAIHLLEREVDAGHQLAIELKERLDERTGKRVSMPTREAIETLYKVARTITELERLAAGKLDPSFDTAGRALSLRLRWRQLCELTRRKTLWPKELIREVIERIKSEGALKQQYERAASMWGAAPSVSSSEDDGFEL